MFCLKNLIFSRLKSCPALIPKPILFAKTAASVYGFIASLFPKSNWDANSSVYSSILSAPVSAAASISLKSVSIKIEVLIPFCLNSWITSFKKVWCFTVFQPALEVIAWIESGTKVTCVGFVSITKSIKDLIGFPSILNSVFTTATKSLASWYLMCLSSVLKF
jgi:hypothetical protein